MILVSLPSHWHHFVLSLLYEHVFWSTAIPWSHNKYCNTCTDSKLPIRFYCKAPKPFFQSFSVFLHGFRFVQFASTGYKMRKMFPSHPSLFVLMIRLTFAASFVSCLLVSYFVIPRYIQQVTAAPMISSYCKRGIEKVNIRNVSSYDFL